MAVPLALAHATLLAASLGMHAVRTDGACGAPFDCVKIATVPRPIPMPGHALIRVNSTSVNPSDVDRVESGSCEHTTCGADVSGTVIACPACTTFRQGDAVWTMTERGAYCDYIVSGEGRLSLKPPTMSHIGSCPVSPPIEPSPSLAT